MKKLILFVCNGNIHRSVIAAEILNKIFQNHKINQKFLVDSYGIQGTNGTELPKHKRLSDYPKEWNAAKPTLQNFDIDISKHRFQKITPTAIKKADVIIAMDDKVYSEARNSLIKQFPKYKEKIHRFSELSKNNNAVKDLAGNGSEKSHQKIIEYIYTTLSKKYKNILEWVE